MAQVDVQLSFILGVCLGDQIYLNCYNHGTMGGKMNPSNEFEFMVGEKYENEKGIFSVMSIEKDKMVIQWANGEEIQTSIEFQGRIQKRREWEKTQQKEKTTAAKPTARKANSSKSS
jgi:uncharacterized Zn finger protein